jgi:hypothetical protein
MNFTVIYSRDFLVKVFGWPDHLKDMAFEAAEHAAQDPNLHEYSRAYLVPFRQKHPTTDHQYTLYFLIISRDEIFIAWINDTSCLHDTRANFADPCLKEFNRLKARGLIENYDPTFHKIRFEVRPDSKKPLMCRSFLLGQTVQLNSYIQDPNTLVGHAFFCSEPVDQIAETHVGQFLNLLHSELSKNHAKSSFQIEFTKQGHARETELLTKSHDTSKWVVVHDNEDFILKRI